MEASELEIVRRAYAKQVMAAAEITGGRVEAAFAAVKREDFLGPGPWPILRWQGPAARYVTTPGADPVVRGGSMHPRPSQERSQRHCGSRKRTDRPQQGQHIGIGTG